MHGKSFPILPKSSSIKASVHCYCARCKQNTEVHKKDIMTSAFTFSRRFYPKRLTRMYTQFLHLHCWHTAHQEQLGVQCLAQGRFDRESNRSSYNLHFTSVRRSASSA